MFNQAYKRRYLCTTQNLESLSRLRRRHPEIYFLTMDIEQHFRKDAFFEVRRTYSYWYYGHNVKFPVCFGRVFMAKTSVHVVSRAPRIVVVLSTRVWEAGNEEYVANCVLSSPWSRGIRDTTGFVLSLLLLMYQRQISFWYRTGLKPSAS